MLTAAALLPREHATRSPGRIGEFLLVGGLTVVLWPLTWLLRQLVGFDDTELAVGFLTFYGAHLINDPHFSVTYLLFYKDVARRVASTTLPWPQRARYVLAGFVVPALLLGWAGLAVARRSPQLLGWLMELMFLLVGWHYVKQGFGVLTVLAARRGVLFSARERLGLLAQCFCAWGYAWANPARAAGEFEEQGLVYRSPARPVTLESLALAALLLSTLWLAWLLFTKWRRERPSALLFPLAAFLITTWSWTIYASVDPILQYLIPALHSLQYLYFVWLLKRNQARAAEGPPSFGRPVSVSLGLLALSALVLGWFLFHGAPGALDLALVTPLRRGLGTAGLAAPWLTADGPLGPTPFVAAAFASVNIHHYFMDYVIWRRENPETRFLREPNVVA